MENIKNGSEESPIIVYYYFDLSDTEAFCSRLEKRFRDSGHTRPLEFRNNRKISLFVSSMYTSLCSSVSTLIISL